MMSSYSRRSFIQRGAACAAGLAASAAGRELRALAIPGLPARGKLVTYPAPDGAVPARDFRVRVNGQEIFVYDTEVAGVTYCSFDGQAEVEVDPSSDVKRVDVRPMSLKIQPLLRDNTIRFTLAKPANLSIELNGESQRVLYLFASPLETSAPSPQDAKVHYFAPGRIYDAGTIELHSGETLYVAGGAVVRGTVVARGARNVRITGRGILESEGKGKQKTRLIQFIRCRDVEVSGVIVVNSQTWTLVPVDCDNVTIRNVKLVNWQFGSDGIDLVATSNVLIEGCFLRDNDDCIAVKVWGDGAGYPKSNGPGPDVRHIRVLDSVFWNMAWGNALEIGFELRARSVSDILFRNCDVIHVERGAVLSIHNGDYATVSDVRYEDIRVEDARHKLIDLAIFLSQYSVDRPPSPEERRRLYLEGAWDGVLRVPPGERAKYAKERGHIRNITFKNIQVVEGPFPFSIISGYDANHLVEDVTVEHLTVCGRPIRTAEEGKFFVENARNFRIIP
jgi:hypothetical protein